MFAFIKRGPLLGQMGSVSDQIFFGCLFPKGVFSSIFSLKYLSKSDLTVTHQSSTGLFFTMAMHLIKYTSKGVSAGIGIASEAVVEIKNRGKNSEQDGLDNTTDEKADDASTESEDLDEDDAEWVLDDAAAELDDSSSKVDGTPETDAEIPKDIKSFLARLDLLTPSQTCKPLPMPVILPQRRPKSHGRGFVRGYAPLLEECAGIDQDTFLDFLEDFDRASKASPVFDVINLAALGVGLVPTPFMGLTMGVSIAVQFASNTGKELQTRVRRNSYLDQVNEKLFMPRGLYCLIMTFKPDNPLDPVVEIDSSANPRSESDDNSTSPDGRDDTSIALSKSLSPADSNIRRKLKQLRLSSGQTEGEIALPDAAPLIYRALDLVAQRAMDDGRKRENFFQTSSKFLDAYLDRRAQARWSGQHSSSKLARMAPPEEKKFVNRFADPNHPVHSGTIIGLVTGGKVDPVADMRAKYAQWRARRKGIELSEEEVWNARMGRRTAVGPVGRLLRRDVLYMTVTNLPSREEMDAAVALASGGKGEDSGK